jgi:hypothetical protein
MRYSIRYAIALIGCIWGSQMLGQAVMFQEFLSKPTNEGICVQLFFAEPAEWRVHYGTASNALNTATPWKTATAADSSNICIGGLQSSTTYFYAVEHRPIGSSTSETRGTHSFKTQKPAGTPFVFVIEADPHLDEQSDTAIYRICLNNQLLDEPDFMVDLGDNLMTDKLKNTQGQITHDTIIYRSKLFRDYYSRIGHSVPTFLVLGNHEGELGWALDGTDQNYAIWNTQERKKYFPMPEPSNFYTGDNTEYPFVGKRQAYYAWEWGDALFAVIDPYWFTSPKPDSLHGWRWTLGEGQYNWLKQTLENSNAKFKFVFCHQLVGGAVDGRGGIEFADLYEWGGNNLDGTYGFTENRPGWYKPIREVLEENEVTAFFHGHDHLFAKQEQGCLIYQECPQPSHPNFANANQADDYGYLNGEIFPNSGHMRVSVEPESVTLEYVRVYKPANENNNRHNRDVSVLYTVTVPTCYDTSSTSGTLVWNAEYAEEIAFPNPFSKQCTIEFSSQESDQWQLSIYDANGTWVKNLLVNQHLNPGKYMVIWDGTNQAGNTMPHGTYIYQVSSLKTKSSSGKIVFAP